MGWLHTTPLERSDVTKEPRNNESRLKCERCLGPSWRGFIGTLNACVLSLNCDTFEHSNVDWLEKAERAIMCFESLR